MDENLEIRLQRAESWIKLAKGLEGIVNESSKGSWAIGFPRWAREHELFIFYWIAFNALYGTEDDKEWSKIESFIKKVETMAKGAGVEAALILKEATENCLGNGEAVIQDKFLNCAYWKRMKHEEDVAEDCKRRCEKAKKAVARGEYYPFLYAVFKHLLVLRNQVMHGSASHGQNSKGYRDSVLPGLSVVRVLVPALFDLTKRYGGSPTLKWEKVPFPRFGSEGHPWKSTMRISKRANG